MIGFYNYSVIMTYVGLSSTIIGITQVISGNYKIAILCLIISGVCDMFDGNIARTMKNRTEPEKQFGIEIDSLCDIICFCVFPAVFSYAVSGNKLLGTIAAVMLILGGVIRLAYFNVMELKRQKETTGKRKVYQGLPVTSMSMILPPLYILRDVFGSNLYSYIVPVVLIIVSILFVLNFKFKKPGKTVSIIMALYGVALLFGTLFI